MSTRLNDINKLHSYDLYMILSVIWSMHNFRNYMLLPDNLKDDPLYRLFVRSSPDYVAIYETVY